MNAAAELDRGNSRIKGAMRLPVGALNSLKNIVIGTLFCLTPFTAVFVLGWFSRFSARIIDQRTSDAVRPRRNSTGWIMDSTQPSSIRFWLGGLLSNLGEGIRMTVAMAAVTLPFTLIWLGAWWAGWENSFNKGYEQAFLGPAVFIFASLAGATVLSLLPFAFCHVAYQRRLAAVFEWRTLYRLSRLSGWRYVVAAFAFVFFSLPLLASRSLPVFYQDIIPGSADWGAERLEEFRGQIALVKAAYVFLSLCLFRYVYSRLYAGALIRDGGRLAPWRTAMVPVYGVLLFLIWGSFVFLLLVSQFMNMNWFLWISHPFVLLPWMP